jgi:hypothetical protein
MSAKHQQCTGRGCVTCAQRAESSAKLSPSTSLRNDGCAACDNRAHPEMNKEEGQVDSPIHQLTSNHAGGYLASNTNANNNYNHVISNVVTTTEVTMQAQRPVSLGHPRRRSGSRVRAASNHTAASCSSRGDRRAGNWATDQSYVLPSPLQCRTHLDEGSPRRPAKFSSARTIGAGSTYQKASGERRDPTDTL